MIDFAGKPGAMRSSLRNHGANTWQVSVIIPAYRAANTIGRAIQSVLDQTFPATEILVIDDGSPDDIEAAVSPFGSKIRLIKQSNGGAASARNTGIDLAQGNLIAFLDADDYWEPEKLNRHIELYRSRPHLGLTCSGYFEQEPGQERREVQAGKDLPRDCERTLSGRQAFELGCKVSTITVVVPRPLLREARFPTGLKTAEDRHLWIRLVAEAPVYYLAQPLATAVLEPDSLSRSDIEDDCANMLRVVHEYEHLLGRAGKREWESRVYRRKAGVHLAAHRPHSAIGPALAYLRRQPLNLRGWWVLLKSCLLVSTTWTQTRAKSLRPKQDPSPVLTTTQATKSKPGVGST